MVWCGMAWHGMVWYGMVWHDSVLPACHSTAQHAMVWHDSTRRASARWRSPTTRTSGRRSATSRIDASACRSSDSKPFGTNRMGVSTLFGKLKLRVDCLFTGHDMRYRGELHICCLRNPKGFAPMAHVQRFSDAGAVHETKGRELCTAYEGNV